MCVRACMCPTTKAQSSCACLPIRFVGCQTVRFALWAQTFSPARTLCPSFPLRKALFFGREKWMYECVRMYSVVCCSAFFFSVWVMPGLGDRAEKVLGTACQQIFKKVKLSEQVSISGACRLWYQCCLQSWRVVRTESIIWLCLSLSHYLTLTHTCSLSDTLSWMVACNSTLKFQLLSNQVLIKQWATILTKTILYLLKLS